MVYYDGKLIVYGGSSDTDVHVYDISTSTWTQQATTGGPLYNRYGQYATVVDQKMYIFSGLGGSASSEHFSLDLTTWVWT